MKYLLAFFVAMTIPLCGQTVTAPGSLGTAAALGSGDSFIVVQGGVLKIASDAQMTTFAQTGTVLTGGFYNDPTWLTHLSWSKLLSTPTTLAGYDITDPIVLTSGSYANPAWITSLAASKITGLTTYVTASGTNIYTATPSPALSGYTTGLAAYVLFTNANTGGAALNLNSLGSVPIQQNGSALTPGQIPAGATLHLIYDGSNFQIVGNGAGGVLTWSTGLINSSGTITIDPSVVATLTGTQTLTNKSIAWSELTSVPTATTSVLGLVKPDGTTISISGGTISVGTVPWANLSGIPTMPSGAIVGTTDTQTLTNKSIAASEINSGTLTVGQGGSGVSTLTAYAPLFGGTTSTGAIQSGTVGTAGQVMTSNGAGALPTFQNTAPSKWVYTAGNLTATAGEVIMTGGASGTITLPASPVDGETVVVADVFDTLDYGLDVVGGNSFQLNPETVTGGTNIIESLNTNATSIVLNKAGEIATFVWVAAQGNWVETDTTLPRPAGTPAIAGGTGAGTSPTVSVAGSDVSGLITITPGSSPATAATVATITYHSVYGIAPAAVILTPANAAAAALSGTTNAFISASNTGTFIITSGSAALTASTQYKWWYSIPQQ